MFISTIVTLTPLGLLFVVINILGVVTPSKYLENSSIFCSPLISSSSASVMIVSSFTRILSIVRVTPLGAASSPCSSRIFYFFNFSIFAPLRFSIFFINTTSCLFYLFLMSLGFSILIDFSLSCFLVTDLIFLSSFSSCFYLRLSSTVI